MKKFALILLSLSLVFSLAFAGWYTNEEVGFQVDSFFDNSVVEEYDTFSILEGSLVFGYATPSESFDISTSLNGNLMLNAVTDRYLLDSVGYSFYFDPAFDMSFKVGSFSGWLDADVGLSSISGLDSEGESEVDHDYSMAYFETGLDYAIPVSSNNDYFDIYADAYCFVPILSKEIGGRVGFGFGYYLPLKNSTVSAYNKTSQALDEYGETDTRDCMINDLKFVAKTDAYTYLFEDFRLISDTFVALNFPFAEKDNALSTYAWFYENLDAYEFIWEAGLGSKYFVKYKTGSNELDYFSLKADLSLGADNYINFDSDYSYPEFEVVTGAEVHIPNIIPVDLVDNISLAWPTTIKTDYRLSFAFNNYLENYLDYSVEVVPFYMEVKKDAKFLNMNLNTVKLSAEFEDGWEFAAGDITSNGDRKLSASLTFGLDPVKANSVNSMELSAGYVYNFKYARNHVTIALNALF